MASIYTNLRTERQYRASTGLSEQTFNQLFEHEFSNRSNGQFREMARRLMVRELLNEYYHTAVFEIKNADRFYRRLKLIEW